MTSLVDESFLFFSQDFIKSDGFKEFWKKISRVYNRNDSDDLKIATVNCLSDVKICEEQNITELISVKYFPKDGDKFDSKPMQKFFEKTIAESLTTYQLENSTMAKLNSGRSFVKFYAPDCKRCESLAPVWAELQSSLKDIQDLTLFTVNCKEQKNVCNFFNIESYPTLLNIDNGSSVEKYKGDRTLKDLQDYVEKNFPITETRALPEKFVKEKAVFDVTPENYQDLISKDFVLVYFCLKRCTYCQELNKIYDKLADHFISSKNVTIALADCGVHPGLCIKESKGCPTLTLYGNGQLLKKDYHEDHSLKGLIDFVESHVAGGKVLDDWKESEKEKRRLRKEREKKEDEAKSTKQ